jgi:ABC-type antimicrobial peptide transport system ATPase subunit
MSAYDRGNLSPEAYLVRILAGIVRQSGGEVRIKAELIDHIGEATFLIKEWDSHTQELVLRAGMHQFSEVFRVNPEKHVAQMPQREQVVDPAANMLAGEGFLPKRNTSSIDDQRIADIEHRQRVARAAALIRDELRKKKEGRINGSDQWTERGTA